MSNLATRYSQEEFGEVFEYKGVSMVLRSWQKSIILVSGVFVGIFTTSSLSLADSGRSARFGTGDSGGGNTYQQRPLESYIEFLTDLREPVRDILFGKMSYFYKHHPRLFRLMIYGAAMKTWYFVPGHLEALPSAVIGSAVPTEQVALQDLQNIWINHLLLDKMADEDQVELIFHEIVMAIKLLKFQDDRTICIAVAPAPQFCEGTSSRKKRGRASDLLPQDHAQIRRATYELFRLDETGQGKSGIDFVLDFNEIEIPDLPMQVKVYDWWYRMVDARYAEHRKGFQYQ